MELPSLVRDHLGDPNGVLIFDESGFPKKGKESVGVARQYCGSLGKVDNCQVGVFAAYVSCHGYTLVDKRLFLPDVWWTDAYTTRRRQCQVPPELTVQTKPELAAAILSPLRRENILPFKYVVADSVYGNSPTFLDAVESQVGLTYLRRGHNSEILLRGGNSRAVVVTKRDRLRNISVPLHEYHGGTECYGTQVSLSRSSDLWIDSPGQRHPHSHHAVARRRIPTG